MSHSVPIRTEFRNLGALKKAFENLGWSIAENSKLNTYYSDPAREKVFKLLARNTFANGYDVGIVVGDDGIILECDFFRPGRIIESLGTEFSELKKKYVNAVTEENFCNVMIEQTFEDGSYILVADDGQ
jgi:hypothetical protein